MEFKRNLPSCNKLVSKLERSSVWRTDASLKSVLFENKTFLNFNEKLSKTTYS